jgi:hypothetical protein
MLPVAWLYTVISLISSTASPLLSKPPLALYIDYRRLTDILGALEDFRGVSVMLDKADLRFSVWKYLRLLVEDCCLLSRGCRP